MLQHYLWGVVLHSREVKGKKTEHKLSIKKEDVKTTLQSYISNVQVCATYFEWWPVAPFTQGKGPCTLDAATTLNSTLSSWATLLFCQLQSSQKFLGKVEEGWEERDKEKEEERREERYRNSLRAWRLSRNAGVKISSGSCLGTAHKTASAQPGAPPGPQSGVSHIPVPQGTEQAELSYLGSPWYWSRDRSPSGTAVEPWPWGALQGPTPHKPTHNKRPRGTEQGPGTELRTELRTELGWWSSTAQGAQAWFPLVKTPRVQTHLFSETHIPCAHQKGRGDPRAELWVLGQGVPEPGAAQRAKRCRKNTSCVRCDQMDNLLMLVAELRGEGERPRSIKKKLAGGAMLYHPLDRTSTSTTHIPRNNGSTLSPPRWGRGTQRNLLVLNFWKSSGTICSVHSIS